MAHQQVPSRHLMSDSQDSLHSVVTDIDYEPTRQSQDVDPDFEVIEKDESGPKQSVDPWNNAYQHSRAAMGNVFTATKTFGKSLTHAGIGSAMYAVAGATAISIGTSIGKGARQLHAAAFSSNPNAHAVKPIHTPPAPLPSSTNTLPHHDPAHDALLNRRYSFLDEPIADPDFDSPNASIPIIGHVISDPRFYPPPDPQRNPASPSPRDHSTPDVIIGPAQRRKLPAVDTRYKPSAANGEATPRPMSSRASSARSLRSEKDRARGRQRERDSVVYGSSPYARYQHAQPDLLSMENEHAIVDDADGEDGGDLLMGFAMEDDEFR